MFSVTRLCFQSFPISEIQQLALAKRNENTAGTEISLLNPNSFLMYSSKTLFEFAVIGAFAF